MTITLDNSNRTKALWCIQIEKETDFMGALQQDASDPTEYHFTYRFRYYLDDKLDNTSQDKKKWYHITIKDTPEAEVLVKLRAIVKTLHDVSSATDPKLKMWEILPDSRGDESIIEQMKACPMFHIREASPEEVEKIANENN